MPMFTYVVCALYGRCFARTWKTNVSIEVEHSSWRWIIFMPYFHRPTDWSCHSKMRPNRTGTSIAHSSSIIGLHAFYTGYLCCWSLLEILIEKKEWKKKYLKMKTGFRNFFVLLHLFRLKLGPTKNERKKRVCGFCFVHASFVSASCFNIDTWDLNRLKKKLPPPRPSKLKYLPKLLIFDYNVFPSSAFTIIPLWECQSTRSSITASELTLSIYLTCLSLSRSVHRNQFELPKEKPIEF